MFCQKCGSELRPGAVFCIKCGTRAPVMADFNRNITADIRVSDTADLEPKVSKPAATDNDKLTNAVISFQSGDVSAFDTIYNESKKYIYYTILKTTGDKDVADDILQETYLDVYRSLDQLQSPAAFKGWAAKIAQHKISRYYQKKSPELFSTEEEMDDTVGELTEDDMSALPEDAMINKEVQRLISEIIDELPENQKSAIVSFYYNQMSIPEIAESMGVPENTVKTNLSRGRKKIKDGVLEIEKKHRTKLYALPLAGLLGLLFTEEAQAAVVTTTASQVLGSAATAAGGMAVSGSIASVAAGSLNSMTAGASSTVAAGQSVVMSGASSTTFASGTAVTSSSITATAASAATGTASTSAASSVSSVTSSVSMTAHSSEQIAEAVTSSGRMGRAARKAAKAGSKAVARSTGKAAGHTIISSIIRVFVCTIIGFSVGVCSMSYVMNNTEIRETIHEIPVIGKILDIGVEEEERTFLGEWRSTADGNRMTINEDHTFIAVKADGSDPITGTWTGDKTTVVFKEDLGLLGVLADTLNVNITGIYDPDADTITLDSWVLSGDPEVYVRIDGEPEESYENSGDLLNAQEPFVGKWKFGDDDLYNIVELFNDYNVLQEYSATYSDTGKPKGERIGKWSLDGEYIAIDFIDKGEIFRAYLKYDYDKDAMFMVDGEDKSLHEMVRLY